MSFRSLKHILAEWTEDSIQADSGLSNSQKRRLIDIRGGIVFAIKEYREEIRRLKKQVARKERKELDG